MGNVASCAPSIISSGAVKVLFGDGRLVIYTRPLKAAELMLENPGQFVCDSGHLKVGHRIAGLSADEDLELRQIYYLLPMEMLYSVLTVEEMSYLNEISSKALKQGSLNFSKIFPVFGDFCLFPNAESRNVDSAIKGPEPTERYSRQRSWKPALETIMEAPTPPYV
ncbi:OLC1v1014346C1 [Oldenlandia corymbosa var. corymbosa]|uniref:OLC1v1014346C1 n=1 Tax=Oldenlandia corymbosa var. corymbosa TaxID=529605 RepID=A0AAV1E0G1_OLDCO|nr:OLC1v1014346C1 [Oldenlandia corymbosa var. corymbosa]